MDVYGILDIPVTLPQRKHTSAHRVEVCVASGNELSVWEKR